MGEATTIELMIMSGPDDGTRITLAKPKQGDTFIIGRREDCDVILTYDSQISRQHAQLFFKEGQWYVQDLGSRNGTYIDKQKIETIAPLALDQLFRVGRTWLRISQHEG